jgi:hypothetical protein
VRLYLLPLLALASSAAAQFNAEEAPYFRDFPSAEFAGWDDFDQFATNGEDLLPDHPGTSLESSSYLESTLPMNAVDGVLSIPAGYSLTLVDSLPAGVKELVLQVRVRGDYDPAKMGLEFWEDIESNLIAPSDWKVLSTGPAWTEWSIRWELAQLRTLDPMTGRYETQGYKIRLDSGLPWGEALSVDAIRSDVRYRLGWRGLCPTTINSRTNDQAHLGLQYANMTLAGHREVSSGRLFVHSQTLPYNSVAFLFASPELGYTRFPHGSVGNLCLGQPLARYPIPFATGASGSFLFALDLQAMPTVPVSSVLPGETWWFQTWFRDDAIAPGTWNFSNVVGLEFD